MRVALQVVLLLALVFALAQGFVALSRERRDLPVTLLSFALAAAVVVTLLLVLGVQS